MKIILAGGGTGGSVTPLLAIVQELRKQKPEIGFLFIGTRKGVPEKDLVRAQGIQYKSIFSGKLRRYFSLRNCIDPFLILFGFIQSFFIILRFKPGAIVSAGGFVCVPVAWAGWLLRIRIFIHQQDIIPGLANKLIAPLAKKITISFEKSLNDFNKTKTVLTGNPVRSWILKGHRQAAVKRFNLEDNLPTLLVIGGGTGAKKINEIIIKIVPELVKFCQIIHLTGQKQGQMSNVKCQMSERCHQYEFLKQDMSDAYAAADLVISRAGMGVLTELSVLGKPTILIPIPDSHQESNAKYFVDQKAVILMNQKDLTPEILLNKIGSLVSSADQRAILSLNISKLGHLNAAQKIARIVLKSVSSVSPTSPCHSG